jgi:hypothetical protein
MFIKLPRVSDQPVGKSSPNLVTLIIHQVKSGEASCTEKKRIGARKRFFLLAYLPSPAFFSI